MAGASEQSSDRFVRKIQFSSASVAVEWKQFQDEFKIFRIAKGIDKLSEDEKIANMLMLMGPESVPIYEQFVFNDSDCKKTLSNTITLFSDYFEPVKNVIYERAVFNEMKQAQGQPIHAFIVAVQAQAKNCDYGVMCDQLVRDRIVVGVRDDKLRQYLYDVEDLTLAKCIQKAKQYVSHHEHAAKITQNRSVNDDSNVDALVAKKVRDQTGFKEQRAQSSYRRSWYDRNRGYRDSTTEGKLGQKDVKLSSRCANCGKDYHRRGICPAAKSTCYECHKKGHWARTPACKSSGKPVHELEDFDYDTNDHLEGLFLGSDSD